MTLRPAFAALTLALAPLPALAAPATYAVDPDHAVVAFFVDHAGYAKVMGRFTEVEGSFVYDAEANELGEVSVTIDATSVTTFQERRDEHVRSEDFLDAGSHPEITFAASGGTVESETSGEVTGDLTVRGVTRPITLDVTLNKVAEYPCCHGKETVGVSARGTILRSEFGSTYALPAFVGDEVEILIEVEAIRQD